MHLIVTRTFPPEVGGMQNLMYGLAKSLSENVMIKVFADQYPNQDIFDKGLSFSIVRVSGPKIFKNLVLVVVLSGLKNNAFNCD